MLLVRAEDKSTVLRKYLDVAQGERVADEANFRKVVWLKLAGVVREREGVLECRNRVYAAIFTARPAKPPIETPLNVFCTIGVWRGVLERLKIGW